MDGRTHGRRDGGVRTDAWIDLPDSSSLHSALSSHSGPVPALSDNHKQAFSWEMCFPVRFPTANVTETKGPQHTLAGPCSTRPHAQDGRTANATQHPRILYNFVSVSAPTPDLKQATRRMFEKSFSGRMDRRKLSEAFTREGSRSQAVHLPRCLLTPLHPSSVSPCLGDTPGPMGQPWSGDPYTQILYTFQEVPVWEMGPKQTSEQVPRRPSRLRVLGVTQAEDKGRAGQLISTWPPG